MLASKQHLDIMTFYNKRVRKLLPGGIHHNFRIPWGESPLHFGNSSASRLWDMNGKEYLDLHARFGALIVGHGNEEYSNCLKDTIDRVLSVSHSDLDAQALELIARFTPTAEMIRFGVSGTEIVQTAIRLARAYTGKDKFVRFEGHYHGNADNIMGGKVTKDLEPVPHNYLGDLKGTAGRAIGILESQSYMLPWNDIGVLENLLERKADEIAAIITEPVAVNGGSVMPDPEYLGELRKLCNQHNIVLIFDEIITGVRMGIGGAQAAFNIMPDLTTLGKAIAGGGVPVSALVGKKELMSLIAEKKVVHAGTFNGYSLGTAAVKATLEILLRDNGAAYIKMNEKVQKIHNIFRARAKYLGLPLVIQGPPGCAAFHCVDKPIDNPKNYKYSIMSHDIMLNHCLAKHGILVSTLSRIYPNISLADKDVEWFSEHIDGALIEMKEIYDEIN